MYFVTRYDFAHKSIIANCKKNNKVPPSPSKTESVDACCSSVNKNNTKKITCYVVFTVFLNIK